MRRGLDKDLRPNVVTKMPRAIDAFDSTEDAAALSFVRCNPSLRYIHSWGRWVIWDGTVWKLDETVTVYDLIRTHCRESSEWAAQTNADQKKICSPGFVAGVERFCKSDRRYATTAKQFDADDWKLNTPDGIVSLADGKLNPHDKNEYCTKITAVGPKGRCPIWLEFLAVVTKGDSELIAYLQRLVGYCLTGSTREHSLHFFYGPGANGKTTLFNTIFGILNDYAINAPAETFIESRNDRHPTELAMLDGPRIVLAQETESGRKWAETRIKALTGGEQISARRMRQDFYTYQPKFKLLIAGNHKPTLSAVDEASRRRFHVIPFTVTIPPKQRDKSLFDKLRLEWPGILAWAIEGCAEYCSADGLKPPARVIEATNDYLRSQDVLHEWLDKECECDPEYWEAPTLLFNSWKEWTKKADEPVGRQNQFNERLQGAGFQQARDNARGRHWAGIRCKRREIQEQSW